LSGETLKVPGSGAPFVVTVTELRAIPQDRIKFSVDLCGRPSFAMTMLNGSGCVEGVRDFVSGVRATLGSAIWLASVVQAAVQGEVVITLPDSVNCLPVSTFDSEGRADVMVNLGAAPAVTATRTCAELLLVASNTETVTCAVVFKANSAAEISI
jgi:hypothetical protein